MPNPMPTLEGKPYRRRKSAQVKARSDAKSVRQPKGTPFESVSYTPKGRPARAERKPRFGGKVGTLQSRTASRARRLGLDVQESYTRGQARKIRRQLARKRAAAVAAKTKSLL